MSEIHVVTGAGPVGWTVAEQLAQSGHRVRVLTRSGSGPEHPLVQRRRVDVAVPGALDAELDGAVALYHCIHGSAYSAKVWRTELPGAEQLALAAAGRAGAVAVFPESLYAFGPVHAPMTEDTPRTATDGKLGVRADLIRAREASPTPTVSVAASDFYGPRVRGAHAGERMVPTILRGKPLRVLGSIDQPHSFTYVPDLAAAMIGSARDRALWNRFLLAPTAPALTQRELVAAFAAAAEVPVPRLGVIPRWLLQAVGTVHPATRELAETAYQFTSPFVVDSTVSENALGLAPTPLDVGTAVTVRWWRANTRTETTTPAA